MVRHHSARVQRCSFRQGRPVVSKAEVNAVASQPRGQSPPFRLPAVDRAMNLLELLGSSGRGLTLSELSRKLSIPKSTTYYLVYTLVTRGYIQRTGSGHYSLGFRFADVASASTAGLKLKSKREVPA